MDTAFPTLLDERDSGLALLISFKFGNVASYVRREKETIDADKID